MLINLLTALGLPLELGITLGGFWCVTFVADMDAGRKSYGITLAEGRGRLIAPDTVEVNGQRIKTRNVVIATGSVAAQPPIEGADLPGVIGTEEAMELREIPSRIAIIGSRPWDLEAAQYFHAMGSQVTLI